MERPDHGSGGSVAGESPKECLNGEPYILTETHFFRKCYRELGAKQGAFKISRVLQVSRAGTTTFTNTTLQTQALVRLFGASSLPANNGAAFDAAQVQQILRSWREKFKDKKDIVLNTDAQVKYGSLIAMYDLLIASDWPDVGISPK